MRKFKIIISSLVILVLLTIGIIGIKVYQYYLDSRDNRFTISIEMSPTKASLVDGNILSYTATNCGYSDTLIREIVVLSLYDETGEPVPAGGSTYSTSCVELLGSHYPQRKAVQDHQIIYVSEYSIHAGKILFENVLNASEEIENTYLSEYTLNTDSLKNLKVDIILQGKLEDTDSWEIVASSTTLLGNNKKTQETSEDVELPVITNPVSYQWKINKDKAVLTGLGSISEKDIIIPSTIMLSQKDENVFYDPLEGTEYPVEVGSVSFFGTDIQSVQFQDGVTIEKNSMGKDGQPGKGLFGNCVNLVAVENIPDTVTDMSYTFSGCTNLVNAPEIPESVQTMKNCFVNCVSLIEIPTLPKNLESIQGCFKGCEKLKTIVSLPDSIVNMEEAFAECTSLRSIDKIPSSAENMKRTFQNCTSLQTLPELPNKYAAYNGCFKGCSTATGEIKIPIEAINYEEYFPRIKGMFDGCEQLEHIIVPCCEYADIVTFLPQNIDLSFEFTHTDNGLCQGCFYTTSSHVVDGLTVYFDHIPEPVAERLLVKLDTEIPNDLKDTCRKLTFTQSLGKYNSTYADDVWGGFALWPDGTAFVKVAFSLDCYLENASEKSVEDVIGLDVFIYGHTIVHELGHTYDYNYSTVARHSGSQRWRQLCEQEGIVFIQDLQENYRQSQYPEEMFARALDKYFVPNNSDFREACPGMYAYIDELFGAATQ